MSRRVRKCHSIHMEDVGQTSLLPPCVPRTELGKAGDTTAFAYGALLHALW